MDAVGAYLGNDKPRSLFMDRHFMRKNLRITGDICLLASLSVHLVSFFQAEDLFWFSCSSLPDPHTLNKWMLAEYRHQGLGMGVESKNTPSPDSRVIRDGGEWIRVEYMHLLNCVSNFRTI